MASLGRIEKPDTHVLPGQQEASSLTIWRLQAPVLFVGFPEARINQWVSPDHGASNRKFTRSLSTCGPLKSPESAKRPQGRPLTGVLFKSGPEPGSYVAFG